MKGYERHLTVEELEELLEIPVFGPWWVTETVVRDLLKEIHGLRERLAALER